MEKIRLLLTVLVFCILIMMIGFAADVVSAAAKPIRFVNVNSNTVIPKGETISIRYKTWDRYRRSKIVFRSSKKSVVKVSSNGVITAKRNGSAVITISVRERPSVKASVNIRVGKHISDISLSGVKHIRVGNTRKMQIQVIPSNAANKKVKWTSSDSKVAKVTSKGSITGLKAGKVRITAKAVDGSGKKKSVTVIVYKTRSTSTKWIAHRGVREERKENTASAFRLAGKYGFWGCECDVWETKHIVSDDESDTDEDFELVLSHDPTFKRVYGVDIGVKDLTADEIRADSRLSQVCFFDEYIDICKSYNMAPVVELKDPDMTQEGIVKVIQMLSDRELLMKSWIISFHPDILERAKLTAESKYGVTPVTMLLTPKEGESMSMTAFEIATDRAFSGIGMARRFMSAEYDTFCRDNGLKLGLWTYTGTGNDDEILYKCLVSKVYKVDSITVDGRKFD